MALSRRAHTGLSRPAPLVLSPDPWPAAYSAVSDIHAQPPAIRPLFQRAPQPRGQPSVCLSVQPLLQTLGMGGGRARLLCPGCREMPETVRLTLDLSAQTSQVPETQRKKPFS